jgi:hypothetical protein
VAINNPKANDPISKAVAIAPTIIMSSVNPSTITSVYVFVVTVESEDVVYVVEVVCEVVAVSYVVVVKDVVGI